MKNALSLETNQPQPVSSQSSGANSRPEQGRELAGRFRKARRAGSLTVWLGLLPFGVFAVAFMIMPAASILMGSFQDANGAFTWANLQNLARANIVSSFGVTIQISMVSAVGGGIFGFALAWASVSGGLPSWVRFVLHSFSGVASNFAGVPLAFAFIATLGRAGLLTAIFQGVFGLGIYDAGFNLYSFWGLCLTYLYFQIPLMILLITPAIEGLKKEWREAATSLGAGGLRYWWHIGVPILAPSFLAALIMLFGNAFGAYATAYSLTGGMLNLVPILIGAQLRGDVLHDPQLGYALSLGMVAVMVLTALAHGLLQRRVSRWMA